MLRRRREEMGLTQEQLSIAVGVTRAAITQYESGSAKPSLFVAIAIAHVLHSTV